MAGSEEPMEQPLSSIFQDKNPTLSPLPPAPPTLTAPNSPSDSSSSDSSDIYKVLSESEANKIDLLQGLIEKKVDSIVTKEGYENLSPEKRNVLGKWVHGETTDVNALKAIQKDLEANGDKSEDFKEALKALVDQFFD